MGNDVALLLPSLLDLATTLCMSLPALVFYVYITIRDQKFRNVTIVAVILILFSALMNGAMSYVTISLIRTMTAGQVAPMMFLFRAFSVGIWVIGNSVMYVLFAMKLFPKKA